MSKYIYFQARDEKIIEIRNKKSKTILGYVTYYKPWKQYIFSQADEGIIFSWDCLQDIVNYLKEKNK